jgi:hypothetical protein
MLTFDEIIQNDGTAGRGTVIDYNRESREIVFTRLDYTGDRVWDIVSYASNDMGEQIATYRDAKTAKRMIRTK